MESTVSEVIEIFLITTLLVVRSTSSASVLNITPRRSTVIVNDAVGFNCSSTNAARLDWFFIKNFNLTDSQYSNSQLCVVGQSTPECAEISSFGEIKKDFANVYALLGNKRNGTNESYLSIPKVNMQHAGAYRCSGGFDKFSQSNLSVLDPMPRCNATLYNNPTDRITVACSFDYIGVTANLQWSHGVGNMRNNCSRQGKEISCAIPVTNFPNDSCDFSQCNNKGQSQVLVSGNTSFICIWGVHHTMEKNLNEHSYIFLLDSRPVAFVRCFKFLDSLANGMTTLGPGTGWPTWLTKEFMIYAASGGSGALIIILMIVLIFKKGKCCRKAPPRLPSMDDLDVIAHELKAAQICKSDMEWTPEDMRRSSFYATIEEMQLAGLPSATSMRPMSELSDDYYVNIA